MVTRGVRVMRDGLENRLDTIYKTNGDRESLDNAYDEWAQDYDQDIFSSGNPYITLITGLAGRYIPDTNARILDGGLLAVVLRLCSTLLRPLV